MEGTPIRIRHQLAPNWQREGSRDLANALAAFDVRFSAVCIPLEFWDWRHAARRVAMAETNGGDHGQSGRASERKRARPQRKWCDDNGGVTSALLVQDGFSVQLLSRTLSRCCLVLLDSPVRASKLIVTRVSLAVVPAFCMLFCVRVFWVAFVENVPAGCTGLPRVPAHSNILCVIVKLRNVI